MGGEPFETEPRDGMGPLRRHPRNPRYFARPDGRPVVLAGSHTWANFASDQSSASDQRGGIDYNAFLDFLVAHGHNLFRGWVWDLPHSRQGPNGGPFRFGPAPWLRTGPGLATDGLPRFDLTARNDAYYERIRERVAAAERRGIYVAVMLFQGFGWQFDRTDDDGFPYDGRNNSNGVDAGRGAGAATLDHPVALAVQEAYVRDVVSAVAPHDNVLFEIANEAGPEATAWQYHHIRHLRRVLAQLGRPFPIGMTFAYDGGTLAQLEQSGADWISPDSDAVTRAGPPATDGRQVVIYDTDHGYDWRSLRDDGPDRQRSWVWRCALRGAQALFMDPYLARIEIEGEIRNAPIGTDPREPYFGREPDPAWNGLRTALGRARAVLERLDLAMAVPRPDLCSTGYLLVDPGREGLVYAPFGGDVEVRLGSGRYSMLDLDPLVDGEHEQDSVVAVDGAVRLRLPAGRDAVLLLRRIGD